MGPRRTPYLWLATGLILAGTAFLLVNETFEPVTHRFALDGRDRSQAFVLEMPQALFLEYELVVRATGRPQPSFTVTVNDSPVAVPAVTASYATVRANVPLPLDAVRPGENVLRVRVGGAESNTFDMRGRIHNYQRLASRHPLLVVAADEAVSQHRAQTPFVSRVVRLLAWVGFSVGAVWLLHLAGRRWFTRSTGAHVLAVVVGPIGAVAYGIAGPLHVWLSPLALLIIAIVPWLLVLALWWLNAHRATAFAVVVPVLLTCVVLEGALRVYNAIWPTYAFYSESLSRFRGKPGERRFDAAFNSQGFYDVERRVERPADVSYRIVALGDSFAVGVVPLQDGFLARLESQLSTRLRTEVVNMGVAGTDPPQYLSLLGHEGLAYRPDLVLVNLFVGNDLETRAPRWYERSYLATLARVLWRLGRSPAVVILPSDEHLVYHDDGPGMSQDMFMEVEVDRSWIYERDSERVRTAVAQTAGYVRRMRDLARREGADLMAVVIPGEIQVDEALRTQVVVARNAFPEQFDWAQPGRLLAQALAAEDIEVVDLLPALAEAAGSERVYKRNDTHWNLRGNQVAADTLARALITRIQAAK